MSGEEETRVVGGGWEEGEEGRGSGSGAVGGTEGTSGHSGGGSKGQAWRRGVPRRGARVPGVGRERGPRNHWPRI